MLKLTRSMVSQCLLKLMISVIEFTLMLLIKGAEFIICTYILLTLWELLVLTNIAS